MKRILKNKVISFFLAALALFGLTRVYYKLTDDFRLSNITYEIAHHKEWEIPVLSNEKQKEIQAILNQPFTYLGKGAQSYVFSSKDNQYVIKFFKFKHLKPSFIVDALPAVFPFADYKAKEIARKDRKLNSAFNGYRLAYEVHRQETGLIFIHLNKTDHLLNQTVKIIDKIGRIYEIDLDSTVFLLQKKGVTLRTAFHQLLKNNNLFLFKERIGQVFSLYLSEYKKGIYDHDHGVMNNTGFIGNQPIHLDVGKLLKEEKMKIPTVYSQDLEIIYKKIDLWIQKHYPDQHENLAQEIKEAYLKALL
ncbi:MAG TPA: hypothetical protein PLC42_05600 [Parachlamydiaceae bacterium]|nr:hypothetical protein [Parachlamydiaceae bacterium]